MGKRQHFKSTRAAKLSRPTEEIVCERLMKIANHGMDCRCRNNDCIDLRRLWRKNYKEARLPRDVGKASTRVTAAYLAVTINARA